MRRIGGVVVVCSAVAVAAANAQGIRMGNWRVDSVAGERGGWNYRATLPAKQRETNLVVVCRARGWSVPTVVLFVGSRLTGDFVPIAAQPEGTGPAAPWRVLPNGSGAFSTDVLWLRDGQIPEKFSLEVGGGAKPYQFEAKGAATAVPWLKQRCAETQWPIRVGGVWAVDSLKADSNWVWRASLPAANRIDDVELRVMCSSGFRSGVMVAVAGGSKPRPLRQTRLSVRRVLAGVEGPASAWIPMPNDRGWVAESADWIVEGDGQPLELDLDGVGYRFELRGFGELLAWFRARCAVPNTARPGPQTIGAWSLDSAPSAAKAGGWFYRVRALGRDGIGELSLGCLAAADGGPVIRLRSGDPFRRTATKDRLFAGFENHSVAVSAKRSPGAEVRPRRWDAPDRFEVTTSDHVWLTTLPAEGTVEFEAPGDSLPLMRFSFGLQGFSQASNWLRQRCPTAGRWRQWLAGWEVDSVGGGDGSWSHRAALPEETGRDDAELRIACVGPARQRTMIAGLVLQGAFLESGKSIRRRLTPPPRAGAAQVDEQWRRSGDGFLAPDANWLKGTEGRMLELQWRQDSLAPEPLQFRLAGLDSAWTWIARRCQPPRPSRRPR